MRSVSVGQLLDIMTAGSKPAPPPKPRDSWDIAFERANGADHRGGWCDGRRCTVRWPPGLTASATSVNVNLCPLRGARSSGLCRQRC
jgi:hypothetical protein